MATRIITFNSGQSSELPSLLSVRMDDVYSALEDAQIPIDVTGAKSTLYDTVTRKTLDTNVWNFDYNSEDLVREALEVEGVTKSFNGTMNVEYCFPKSRGLFSFGVHLSGALYVPSEDKEGYLRGDYNSLTVTAPLTSLIVSVPADGQSAKDSAVAKLLAFYTQEIILRAYDTKERMIIVDEHWMRMAA